MFPIPPRPLYPKGIDNNYTLFLVHNTTEARLASDNEAGASEMEIIPVSAGKLEIWPDNGFATIEGECFYYDAVEKNTNGKVFKLKRIGRNLSGERSRFNKAGTWVRGFVVAEHHKQLVSAIEKIEDFVGENFSEEQPTLDWRIRHLQELALIFDDYGCPNVDFTFNTTENDPITGSLATYFIEITSPGQFSSFRLDFGDGDFTTTDLQGEHRYALNTPIDPVLTITNGNCKLVLTPAERTNPTEPPSNVPPTVEIPIPENIDLPGFETNPIELPDPQVNIPNIIIPCPTIDGFNLPSIIIGPDLNLVSSVSIVGLDFPIILVSHVQIDGPDFPIILVSHIQIDPPIPSIIIIDPPIPSIIIIENPPSLIGIDWGMTPEIGIDLTELRKLNLQVAFTQQAVKKQVSIDPALKAEFGEELSGYLADDYVIEYEPVSIPSEIRMLAPNKEDLMIHHDLPEEIVLNTLNMPKSIDFLVPEGFGKDIKILGPDIPLPTSIEIVGISEIKIDHNIPSIITLEGVEMLPSIIRLMIPDELPSISLVGMDLIPSIIQLMMPENPEIEMVYRGSPIPVEVKLDTTALTHDKDGKPKQCFMLVPCD